MRLIESLRISLALVMGTGAACGQIFVANGNGGVGEYTLSGVTVSRSLLPIPSGIGFPSSIASDGNGHLFVLTYGGVVGEYTTSGAAINPLLITGLGNRTYGLALDGKGHIFVSNYENGTISEYTTTGETVNGSLISGLNGPVGIAVDKDGHLYVANIHNGIIGEYLTSGDPVNPNLISANAPWSIVLDGNGNLYVAENGGAVAVYKTTGEPINESLISGLAFTYGVALDGQGHLFVINWGYNEIAEYTTDGTLINPALVTGLDNPLGLIVQSPQALPTCNTGGPYSVDCGSAVTSLKLDGRASSDPYGGSLTFQWTTDCPGASFDDPTSPTPTLILVPNQVAPSCGVTLVVSNSFGLTSMCSASLSIEDTIPPQIDGAVAKPAVLWPPNHKMIEVTVDYTASDLCDPDADLRCQLSVSSNEPARGRGNGKHSPDWDVIDAHHVYLRAERSGNGRGRIYKIRITCTDRSGNSTSKTVCVLVPKDQGHHGKSTKHG